MSKWLVVTLNANVILPPRLGFGSTERRMPGSDAGLAAAAAGAAWVGAAAAGAAGLAASAGFGASVGFAAAAGAAGAAVGTGAFVGAGLGASAGFAAGAGGWLHAVSSATPKPRVWPSIRRRESREPVRWSPMRSSFKNGTVRRV